MEMEKAAKEAEAASGGGGVWVWLPDQTLLGQTLLAASISEKNPPPESLQPPCSSPPQGFLESFEGASPVVFQRNCDEQDDEVDHYETDYYGHNGDE